MGRRARACVEPGCPAYAYGGPRCERHRSSHQAEIESRRASTAERGYGARWRRLRAWFLKRHPLCVQCRAEGVTTPATEVDHIVPLSRGGTNATSNLQALCKPHHSAKSAREDGRRGGGAR